MTSLIFFIVTLILQAICYLLMPKKKTNSPTPADLKDFDIPSCTEGTQIPVVFGKRYVEPNVTWYGNFRTEAVKKNASGKK